MENKVVLITGASNGMGLEAAKLFAENEWKVYAGARRVEKIPATENIIPVKLDVTDSKSNKNFIDTVLKKEDHIDVLINNAGYGEFGPGEEIPMDNIRKQFETNFFGAVELAQLVLPVMREQKQGRIINISSIGGNIYMPMGSFYHATKAAIQQWSDTLDAEVKIFGVRSIVIQPGGTKSAWGEIAMENAEKNLTKNSVYKKSVNFYKGIFARIDGRASATSADLAKLFYKAATDQQPNMRYFNSLGDRLVVRFAKVHPSMFKAIIDQVSKRSTKN